MPDELVDQLERTIDLASQNVHDHGGPFGALIVTSDGRVFEGVNRVTADNDPTAHAEVIAIRLACRELGTYDLSGSTLYASCEPCPMCLAAALWAKVGRVYFAADRHDAARAGFGDAAFYDYIKGRGGTDLMPVVNVSVERGTEPFLRWQAFEERAEY